MQKKNNTRSSAHEPQIVSRYHEHIAPGEYFAIAHSYQIYRDSEWRRWVCTLQFTVVDNELNLRKIATLTRFLNLGEGKEPKATSRRSHYRLEWCDANGGPPKRGQRMSPSIFLNRLARVVVGDSNSLADDRYSKVTKILSWETGNSRHQSTINNQVRHREKRGEKSGVQGRSALQEKPNDSISARRPRPSDDFGGGAGEPL